VDCRAELRAVSDAVLAVTSHLSPGEVLQTIVTSARQLLGAQYAALGVPDDAGGFAQFVVDGVSDEQWRAIGPLPRQHGLLAVLLHDPTPIRVADIRAHPRFGWWPAAHPKLVDFLGMPIVEGDRILGALFLANKTVDSGAAGATAGGFTDEDQELLRLLANHAAIALVNARLHERSRELSIMEERNRIARELHDAVAQRLFSLRLTAEAAAALLERDPGRAAAELAMLRALAADAADELRGVVIGLRSADLAGDGLDLALRKQVELLDRVHEPRVRYTSEAVPRLAAAREEAVYRVAQEALHNALRHAKPAQVDVRLIGWSGGVVLEVRDDGHGFDTAAAEAASRRLGLASMRERARSAGGRLAVTSRPTSGRAGGAGGNSGRVSGAGGNSGRVSGAGGSSGTTVRLEVPARG
jgi:signal transduction histidine kinase